MNSSQTTSGSRVVEPAVEASGKEVISSHPAFAQISAGRVSGHAVLYGSDFIHHSYIRLRIAASTLRRDLAHDWPHADMLPYIEVNLSEAQWAHFVSSLNMGGGTQCTVSYLNGEDVPGIASPVDRRAQFASESDERVMRSVKAIKDAMASVDGMGLSKSKTAALMSSLEMALTHITSNREYVADQFGRHMEATTEQAKAEVDGYVANVMRQLSIAALAGKQADVPGLPLSFPSAPVSSEKAPE